MVNGNQNKLDRVKGLDASAVMAAETEILGTEYGQGRKPTRGRATGHKNFRINIRKFLHPIDLSPTSPSTLYTKLLSTSQK
jgi:hypothetical protein